MLVLRGAHDGVALEVADPAAVLGTWRSLGDGSFPSEPAPTVVAAVALAALLDPLAEVVVEGAAPSSIVPDEAIDGFVTDAEQAIELEPAGDLLRTPVLLEAGDDESPGVPAELRVASRPRATSSSVGVGHAGPVAPVTPGITPDLAADGAWVTAESPSDTALGVALFAERGQGMSLL